jgi:hypothetical protein
MTHSPNLALPYLSAAQAQKHVTVNEALRILDAVVMLALLDRDLAAPPASPADGARYIVAAGATGAWAGHAGAIAAWQDGAWAFIAPRPGFLAYVVDEASLLVWDGSAWQGAGSGGAPSAIDNLTRLGVGTAADATNPFAAKLNNALWTAKTAAEGGDGSLRYKMNKENAAATLSLLMQTGYSGRAEIGLTGDDDLRLKVSPDGATWIDAIHIDRTSGRVAFPANGGPREVLTAPRTYYVRADGSDSNSGRADSAGDAFLTIQKAIDTVAALDTSIHAVTVQVGAGTYTGAVALKQPVGAGTLTLIGDITTPSNVVISTTDVAAISATGNTSWTVRGFKLQTAASGHGIFTTGGAYIKFNSIIFGTCASSHLYASLGASLQTTGDYAISGGANAHWQAQEGGRIDTQARTVTISNTPAFSTSLAYARLGGGVTCHAMTFSGTGATGKRFTVETNAVVFTSGGGASYLPGNSAGSTTTGGQYA